MEFTVGYLMSKKTHKKLFDFKSPMVIRVNSNISLKFIQDVFVFYSKFEKFKMHYIWSVISLVSLVSICSQKLTYRLNITNIYYSDLFQEIYCRSSYSVYLQFICGFKSCSFPYMTEWFKEFTHSGSLSGYKMYF